MKMCSFTRNIPACGVHPVVSYGLLPGLWLEIRLVMLSLMVSWFSPRGVLPGLWLEIRLEMLYLVVSTQWCHGVHPLVLWCPPRGVVVSCLVCALKLNWKCYPSWCPPCLAWLVAQNYTGNAVLHGFHLVVSTPWYPVHGVFVVSCLVHGLKLDWKFVSVISPK